MDVVGGRASVMSVDPDTAVKELAFNQAQLELAKSALVNQIQLIVGPPGTGKTYYIRKLAEAIMQDKHMKQSHIITPSNNNADDIAIALDKIGLTVLRETASTHPEILKLAPRSHLERIPEYIERLEKLRQSETDPLILKQNVSKLRHDFYQQVYATVQVVMTTSMYGSHHHFKPLRADVVIIDECGRMMEAEAILPITKHVKKIVVVGDPHQIGPTTYSKEADKVGLKVTLLDRLKILGFPCGTLRHQYRMSTPIMDVVNIFYKETPLIQGLDENGLAKNWSHFSEFVPTPIMFINVKGNKVPLIV